MKHTALKRILLTAAASSVPLSLYAFREEKLEAMAAAAPSPYPSPIGTALVVGYNNLVYYGDSGVVGIGLRSGEAGSLTVGRYNTQSANALFTVGTGYYNSGTSTTVRRNALEVLSTGVSEYGTVSIPGTVSLGGAGAGQTVSVSGAAVFSSTLNVTGANALTVAGVPVLKKGDSVAIGSSTTSTGGGIAFGTATGGVAANNTAASGYYSFASGDNSKANGVYSFASGLQNTTATTAHSSFALGFGNQTGFGTVSNTGVHSLALGYFNQSKGAVSMSLGANNIANNNFSVALGHDNRTWRYGQTVVGRFNRIETQPADPNTQPPNDSTADETDEVFVVGGGSAATNRKNAFMVRASGDTTVLGDLRVGTADIKSNSAGSAVFTQPVILLTPAGDIPSYVP